MSEPEAAAAAQRDRFPVLLATGVLAVLLAVGAAGLRSWKDLAVQRAREAQIEASIARTDAAVRALRARVRRLDKDPVTLERLARQELGLVRPDDVVFVFAAPGDARRGPSPAASAPPPAMAPPAPALPAATPAVPLAAPATPPASPAAPTATPLPSPTPAAVAPPAPAPPATPLSSPPALTPPSPAPR